MVRCCRAMRRDSVQFSSVGTEILGVNLEQEKVIIREYQSADCKELAELFYNTVHRVNVKDYTKEQLDVWATGRVDLEKWDRSFQEHYSVVAVDDGMIVGFGDIDKSGYLDRLYVHENYQRRGVATAICDRLEQAVRKNIITHASITAKPFFEKRDYKVIKEQQVERQGIFLKNFIMEKARQICVLCVLFSLFSLVGCSKGNDGLSDQQIIEEQMSDAETQTAETQTTETQTATMQTAEPECMTQPAETATDETPQEQTQPVIAEVDWSGYFDGINGTAVIFDASENCYQIYNPELADIRRSPCSTFKIVSSLIALENGMIKADDSTREWSGEIYWNEDWNRDIDFPDAFHTSCVWYFREVVDEVGQQVMEEELSRLRYGNGDISDWEGRLNTNNSNPALTGFWLESSLLISPKEQAEVMENIFGGKSDYSEQTINQLEQVMLLPEQYGTDILIYGKTGMGTAHGIVVDSWFTGVADSADKRISFCVYLGETDDKNVSSAKAREIATEIVSDYLNRSHIPGTQQHPH